MNLPCFNPAYSLDRAAAAHPQRVSLWYGERAWTVKQAAQCTRALAAVLTEHGVYAGDRVVLIARNSPYHLLLHLACARVGAIFAPVSYRFSADELQRIVSKLDPSIVVADPETVQILNSHRIAHLADVPCFVLDDDDQSQLPAQITPDPSLVSDALCAGWLGLAGTAARVDLSEVKHSQPELGVYPEGVGAIMLTSGSTGEPKYVPLTHQQLWWGSQNFREGFEYSTMDVELVVAPLTHIGGFNGTTLDLFSHGGTVVVVREFRPAVVLQELERRRVAIMFAVPTMCAALMRHPDFSATDLSAFRLPLTGGSVVSAELLHQLQAAGLHPLNVWGMTETSASGCYLPAEHLDRHAGSIGRPFAHVQVRIVAEDGSDAEPGAVGELWLRGPSVATEYWRDVEATAAALCHGVGGDAGTYPWLRTGDLVRSDAQGWLWVVGRKDDIINTGGEKVSPTEVMRVLATYPGVSEVEVVGVPDPLWGHAIAAVFIMHSGEECPPLRGVREFAARHLADFKLPRIVVCVQEFPTNSNGKLDRRALAEVVAANCACAHPTNSEVHR